MATPVRITTTAAKAIELYEAEIGRYHQWIDQEALAQARQLYSHGRADDPKYQAAIEKVAAKRKAEQYGYISAYYSRIYCAQRTVEILKIAAPEDVVVLDVRSDGRLMLD